jgi:hypothetical protein
MATDISEEYIISILKDDEKVKQEAGKQTKAL